MSFEKGAPESAGPCCVFPVISQLYGLRSSEPGRQLRTQLHMENWIYPARKKPRSIELSSGVRSEGTHWVRHCSLTWRHKDEWHRSPCWKDSRHSEEGSADESDRACTRLTRHCQPLLTSSLWGSWNCANLNGNKILWWHYDTSSFGSTKRQSDQKIKSPWKS